MKAYFVTFLSPGVFVAEETTKEIAEWNPETAMEMAKGIIERHSATPYGFYFSTRERNDDELDSHETERSGLYYLGGTILTLEEIKARNDPDDDVLIRNMEGNGWDKVIENRNSWRWTQPFKEGDVILEWSK